MADKKAKPKISENIFLTELDNMCVKVDKKAKPKSANEFYYSCVVKEYDSVGKLIFKPIMAAGDKRDFIIGEWVSAIDANATNNASSKVAPVDQYGYTPGFHVFHSFDDANNLISSHPNRCVVKVQGKGHIATGRTTYQSSGDLCSVFKQRKIVCVVHKNADGELIESTPNDFSQYSLDDSFMILQIGLKKEANEIFRVIKRECENGIKAKNNMKWTDNTHRISQHMAKLDKIKLAMQNISDLKHDVTGRY